MVTVLAGVAAASRVLLILILQVPALSDLVALLADQLVTVILIVQTDVNLPGLVTCAVFSDVTNIKIPPNSLH